MSAPGPHPTRFRCPRIEVVLRIVRDSADTRLAEPEAPAAEPAERPAVAPAPRAAPGLVICAKTRREGPADTLAGLYGPSFPGVDLLDAAVGLVDALPRWDGREGPRARVIVGPGMVAVERRDLARLERSAERAVGRHVLEVDQLAAAYLESGEFPDRPASRREITEWSRRSRARMVRALCELDYSPLLRPGVLPAMITLTYPGDWLPVAPNGAAVKRHLDQLRKRWARAWGVPLVCIWKLEFQDRGAPHFHLLVVPPLGVAAVGAGAGQPFMSWLSAVWAAVVAHPDPQQRAWHLAAGTRVDYNDGLRSTDPRRVAVYFTKHGLAGAKEYQHIVPEPWREPGQGPGRFWGYWHLKRETRAVEVDPWVAVDVARTLRRWARAQGTTRQVTVWRSPGGRARPVSWEVVGLAGAQLLGSQRAARPRKVRRRVARLAGGAGWVSVNDGAAMLSQVARYLDRR